VGEVSRARNVLLAGGLALTAGLAGAGAAQAKPGAFVLPCLLGQGEIVVTPSGVEKICTGPPVAKPPPRP
jgi:hypothetical protein